MLSENNEDTDGLRGSRQGGYLVSGSWMITEIICYIYSYNESLWFILQESDIGLYL